MQYIKEDKYKSARGGNTRILLISCNKCEYDICYYQKDGPGPLKRMYLDRILSNVKENDAFSCPNCNELLGMKYIYEKESRPAYKLFVDTVGKKIVGKDSITSVKNS